MSRPFTKLQVAAIEQLAADGLTIQQTANKIGATYHQVNHLRKKLNIKFVTGKYTTETNDSRIRKKWERLLPELKYNLLEDIARIKANASGKPEGRRQ